MAAMITASERFARSTAQRDEAFRKGEEFKKNNKYSEAMRSYRAAADQGHAQAQVEIGNLYGEGQGVAQNHAEALRWFRMAAERGNAEAQNNVGLFYVSGMGVAKDSTEGMRWLRKSADQGNEVAQRNIGMVYLQAWVSRRTARRPSAGCARLPRRATTRPSPP
jgi:TPR repeat protein